MKQYLDGTIAIFAGKNKLEYTVVKNYIKSAKTDKIPAINNQAIPRYIPDKDHPYRQQYRPEKKYNYPSSATQLQQLGQIYDR